MRKKKKTPESIFLINLNRCSKNKDLDATISLYDNAVSQNLRLNHQNFNTLLYTCSNSVTDPSSKIKALEYGFRIYNHMLSMGIDPNEATITAVARLAAAKGDGDYAFSLVKSMKDYGLTPRLRTFDPALLFFCENLEAERAYEVEEYMVAMGITVEEVELAALLKVSADTGREDRVYCYLHKLRSSVSYVNELTAKVIEDWFCRMKSFDVGGVNQDVGRIEEAVLSNGGGWHGLGWIGKGKWNVQRTNVNSSGQCCFCSEQLVSVDIDNTETEMFAQSVCGLASEREVSAYFSKFQDWLDKHSDYEAIVDGANIGLYQQNFAEGGFSMAQLEAVVEELFKRSGNKWPLVVLHNKRFRSLMENPVHRELVKGWMDKGVLYTTPDGSNDDWYWIYAAIKLKCLLVTNDEMRDHIFELLGSSFFLKWKEKHQVRYTFIKGKLKLQMPSPYSLVIQESKNGSWHVPMVGNSNDGSARTWLCISRPSAREVPISEETFENNHSPVCNHTLSNSHQITGKRKERSSSPPHICSHD